MNFYRGLGKFEWGMASIGAGLCLFVMMMITVISVFGRYVLQTDLVPGAYNIIERVVFPLLIFWALPLAHREGVFPRLEIVADTLPFAARKLLALVVVTVELAIFLLLTWYVAKFAWAGYLSARTMQIGSSYYPLWPLLMMVPLAFGLMIIEMIAMLLRDGRALARGREDEAPNEQAPTA
ncbi:TRAP transporter small permease [Mesorhizobium sp. YIM 152430]|uniref:TRAP transporter small permease n=1 Tax=Mesorhizobium sp. YIM 152430 TaxID=3031761 RepID=UPI0023DB1F1D|nr:TRAP transporter small permease [Mesorhizobium sp. YIM 152430]MDF1600717.1 TRAP transporter small permease [Mesorhizobium sp. YIM 152430]